MTKYRILPIMLLFFGASLLFAEPNTLLSRIDVPAGFERVSILNGSFAAKLRSLTLKSQGTNVLDREGEEILCDDEIVAVIDERPLSTKESKGADGIIKLWGTYRWNKGKRADIRFGLENGQKALWKDWRDGLRPRRKKGRILFVQVGVPNGSRANYMRYLTFVAENTGMNSLKRDLEIVLPDDLAPGDIIVSSGGGQNRVGFILDICRNTKGERLFLLAMGGDNGSDIYIPRPYEPMQGREGWFTLDGARYAVGLDQPTALRRFK